MTLERTLSIIKPDAVGKNIIGEIISRLEKGGLRIVAAKMLHLTADQGAWFYAVHKERSFYEELVSFISSGPILAMVLEGEEAIAKNREIMGATNPRDAEEGTIRADFADSVGENAVHGSDSTLTAKSEIAFFFGTTEICPRTR